MAKIKARGSSEVARVCKEAHVQDDESISWRKVIRLLRSDGVILEKRQVRFKPRYPGDSPKGELHDWGWKRIGKLKIESKKELKADPTTVANRWRAGWYNKGYTPC